MPTVKVEKSCGLSREEAYKRVKQLLETDKDLKKMDPSCQFNFNDTAATGSAKGSMFSADMKVGTSGGSSLVTIEVQLPIMLSMAKGMVQSTLEKKLQAALS